MIDTAVRLFQRDGYTTTSWRGLVEEAGTPWGSIAHHFPGGKEELGVEALGVGADLVGKTITRAFERNDTASGAIRWWYGKSGAMLAQSGYRLGCPVATVALETAHTSEALTTALEGAVHRWLDLLATGLRGRGIPASEADDLAMMCLVQIEGALLVARVLGDTKPVDAAADLAAALLDAAAELPNDVLPA